MKKILILILFIFIGGVINAQYKTGIGLRAGQEAGITLNINKTQKVGYEFMLGFSENWTNLTGLYEIRNDAFDVNGMKWYYGGGGHLAVPYKTNDFAIGLNGIVGLEYKLPDVPFVFSFDVMPLIETNRYDGVYFGFDPGFGIKFVF